MKIQITESQLRQIIIEEIEAEIQEMLEEGAGDWIEWVPGSSAYDMRKAIQAIERDEDPKDPSKPEKKKKKGEEFDIDMPSQKDIEGMLKQKGRGLDDISSADLPPAPGEEPPVTTVQVINTLKKLRDLDPVKYIDEIAMLEHWLDERGRIKGDDGSYSFATHIPPEYPGMISTRSGDITALPKGRDQIPDEDLWWIKTRAGQYIASTTLKGLAWWAEEAISGTSGEIDLESIILRGATVWNPDDSTRRDDLLNDPETAKSLWQPIESVNGLNRALSASNRSSGERRRQPRSTRANAPTAGPSIDIDTDPFAKFRSTTPKTLRKVLKRLRKNPVKHRALMRQIRSYLVQHRRETDRRNARRAIPEAKLKKIIYQELIEEIIREATLKSLKENRK